MAREDLSARLAILSPAQRALLELKLKQLGTETVRHATIPRRTACEAAPLSFAQQRLWFLNQLEPESSAYNEAMAVRLEGALDVDALKSALNTIVERHEVLRTRIVIDRDGSPVQVAGQSRPVDLPVLDLSESSESDVQRIIGEIRNRPFNFAQDLMLRTALLRTNTTEHILVVVKHHIASDGWSSKIFWREVASLYAAFSFGQPANLPELPVQYADYAVWQRDWLKGEELERQLSYWKKQLEGAPGVLNLPTDRPRPPVQSHRGSRQSITLSKELSEKLKGLSRTEGVTLFMTLLAAFQTLLYRYTGQEDIVVGSPIANRTRTEVEGLIGFFVNTLVLRSNFANSPTFKEFLARVRETALEAYAHQDLPFEKLVEELKPERTLSHSPFFQVMFVLQNAPSSESEFEGLNVSPVRVDGETAKFDLTLSVNGAAEGHRASLQYNIELFDEATIERLLGHFHTLLEGITANPEQRISELRLLTEAEKHQLLVEWNDTKTDYPKDKCIHQLFEAQVEKTPDAVAVVFQDQQVTYRQLNNRANQLAHYLQKLGVGPEVLVGICVERSVEMIVGLLGILKAGGAYVPLDPTYPKERLEFMVNDSKVPVLVTQKRLAALLTTQNSQVVYLDEGDWKLNSPDHSYDKNLAGGTGPDNLAYIIYTSGSTGQPKGTLITHYNVARLFQATETWFRFDSNDVWTLFHSYAFDFSVWEIWGALLYGGRLVVVPHEISRSPQEFSALLIQQRVTVLNQTPSAFYQLIPHLKGSASREKVALRSVVFGGEALALQNLKPWFECYGDEKPRLINMYGITETTVHVTYRPITRADLESGTGSVIGKPIPDLRVYLLDKNKALVPVGVAGEIYVGGAGVAKGYLGRDELTAERFVTDPFGNDPQAKLYRSGDLARWLPDGNIEYLGRIDDQVKIRGYRVELGEIEAVLGQHPAVREAVVLARADTPGDKRLVAYVVPASGSAPSAYELRSFVQQKLPEYMVPAAYVLLDTLPLTPNGKLDRKALPAPGQSRPELEETYTAPRTPVEELLAQIWSDVLKLDKVGSHDNFFHLGGHSLLATQVISRINHSFQIDIQIRRLFENPTIAGLAASIDASLGIEKHPQRIPPLVPIPRSNEIPLSFAQQRLWFLDRLAPGSATYNVPAAFRLIGELKVHALEQSLNEIVRRHEVLRTLFSIVNGHPIQKILPSPSFSLTYTDLSDRPQTEREQVLPDFFSEESERPFDLSRGPLMRAKLLRLAPQEHALFLNLHHIVSDGWSMRVLYRELSVLYKAYCLGEPSHLPELPIHYADYSIWQRNWLQGEELERRLSFWRKQLDGVSTLQLPTDRARPAVQTYRGSSRTVDFSAQLSKVIKALGEREGVTMFMTLLAAFQVLLSRYCGQSDIAVGSPIADRTRQETEGLIGFFVNTLVLRADLSHNPTFKKLLQQVRETTLNAYAHQELPFEKLVEDLHPDRNLNNSPLFQVMFVFQNNADLPLEFDQLTVKPIRTTSHSAKFDLSLTMSERNGRLRGSVNFNTDLFDASTIERMVGHFKTLLEGIAANSEQRIWELPLLSEAEKHQLLVELNDTKTDYPKDKCIHQLFEAQAEKTPDAEALVFEDRKLTYRELNKKANQLAHHLQKLGVGPDVLVSICVERSIAMVVGLLGILKAGGAYVPLDPSYPKERLEFMLEDTDSNIILTDGVSLKSLPPTSARVICLDRDWEEIGKEPGDNPDSKSTADNLAYVIYTSGSTGVPKGVEVRHRGVARLLFGVDYVQLAKAQSLLHLASISFDAATFEVWGALLHGGRCILFPGKVPSAKELGEVLKKHQVTTLWLTAALFNTVINEDPQALSEVKQLLIGGEVLSVPHVREGLAQLPNTEIINGYGPTESTTFTCCYSIPRQLDENLFSIPIGKPIGNTQVYILDKNLNPVPIGVAGELYIGGDGLARGYLNRPDLTVEKFILNPFNVDPASRLYKTGDLARYLGDGNIEFLGRMDDQVKIRGYRIEPGEIEAVLSQHAGIRQCAVVAAQDDASEKHLVAYVVANVNLPVVSPQLREYLKEKLPDHMIPTIFVFMDSLPLTPSGKVDRRMLSAPDWKGRANSTDYAAPQTPIEQVLAEIFAEVLQVERVGARDNFFDLGGHSLMGIRLVAQVCKELEIELPLRRLFEYPTVAGLADCLSRDLSRAVADCRDESAWRYLIQLKPSKGKQPVFFLPGGLGGDYEFLVYARLIHFVGNDYAFYGLRARSADGLQSAHHNVEEMAADYVKEMRTLQPKGPYYIIGNCIGGIVAYEIAQQLKAQGQEIALLALMDTWCPTPQRYGRYRRNLLRDRLKEHACRALASWKDNYYLARLPYHWQQLRGMGWWRSLSYVFSKTGNAVIDSAHNLSRFSRSTNVNESVTECQRRQVQEGYIDTLRRYRPKTYFGRVVMLVNEKAYDGDPTLGWSELAAGGIDIRKIPGDHEAYIRKYVKTAAGVLGDCLKSVSVNNPSRQAGIEASEGAATILM